VVRTRPAPATQPCCAETNSTEARGGTGIATPGPVWTVEVAAPVPVQDGTAEAGTGLADAGAVVAAAAVLADGEAGPAACRAAGTDPHPAANKVITASAAAAQPLLIARVALIMIIQTPQLLVRLSWRQPTGARNCGVPELAQHAVELPLAAVPGRASPLTHPASRPPLSVRHIQTATLTSQIPAPLRSCRAPAGPAVN
jgi:hypothetical protein